MLGHYAPLACVRDEKGKETEMKRRAALWGVVALSLALSSSAHAGKRRESRVVTLCAGVRPTSVIIKFRPGVAANEQAAIFRSHRQPLDRVIPQLDVRAVRAPRGKTAEVVMGTHKNHPWLGFVEEEAFTEPSAIANDPRFASRRAVLQILNTETMWGVRTGSRDIAIAVLDTGF